MKKLQSDKAADHIGLRPRSPRIPANGERSASYPQKESARETQDRVAEPELLLQRREERVDNLPIRLIEHICCPEERNQRPLFRYAAGLCSCGFTGRQLNSQQFLNRVPRIVVKAFAIFTGLPIAVSYSLVQSIPNAL